jgi:hypothetical protein
MVETPSSSKKKLKNLVLNEGKDFKEGNDSVL